jgi:hypothetical protein
VSVLGVWVIGTVTKEQIRDLPRVAARMSPRARKPAVTEASGELGWWRTKAHESLFSASKTVPGRWSANDDAFRLNAFFDSCGDDSDQAEELRDAVMDLFPPEGSEGFFAAVARKASPFSALAYTLGPDATLQLPGWFGDFLLDADEVPALLPAAESALALTGTPRLDAVGRIQAWLTGLGDAPDFDANELLDGPLRVLRHAARTGQGAAGQVRWY